MNKLEHAWINSDIWYLKSIFVKLLIAYKNIIIKNIEYIMIKFPTNFQL